MSYRRNRVPSHIPDGLKMFRRRATNLDYRAWVCGRAGAAAYGDFAKFIAEEDRFRKHTGCFGAAGGWDGVVSERFTFGLTDGPRLQHFKSLLRHGWRRETDEASPASPTYPSLADQASSS